MVTSYRSLLPSTVGFDRLFSTLDEFDTLFAEGKKISQILLRNCIETRKIYKWKKISEFY